MSLEVIAMWATRPSQEKRLESGHLRMELDCAELVDPSRMNFDFTNRLGRKMNTFIRPFLSFLLVGSFVRAQTAGTKAQAGGCEQAVAIFLASTPETDWMHRKLQDKLPRPRDNEPYVGMLRSFGFKQAAGEVNVIWNKGYVDVQASDIQFSDSYKLIRGSAADLQDLIPSQRDSIMRYFQHVLAASARKTLAKPIELAVKQYHLKEPVILVVPDYAVFDNRCIPDGPLTRLASST